MDRFRVLAILVALVVIAVIAPDTWYTFIAIWVVAIGLYCLPINLFKSKGYK